MGAWTRRDVGGRDEESREWSRRTLLSAVGATAVGAGVGGAGVAGADRTASASTSRTQPAADWPSLGSDPRNSGHHPETTGPQEPVAAAWTVDVQSLVTTSPAVADGTVYAGALNVDAIDPSTGERRWSYTDGRSGYNSPAVRGESVYVTNEYGTVFALDRADGTEQWSTGVGENSYAGATVGPEAVYAPSSDGRLHALSRLDGTEEWATDTGSPYVTTPALFEGFAFVGSNGLYALDRTDGSVQWSVDTGIASAPTVGINEGAVFMPGSEVLYAVDLDGTTRWTWSAPDRIWGSPAVANGTVYAASQDGTVRAMDADSGDPEWTATFGSDLYASPAVVDGVVYIGTPGGMVALRTDDGGTLWEFSPGSGFRGSAAVVDGRVYVGDTAGTLYELRVKTEIPTPTPTPTATPTPTRTPPPGSTPTRTPTATPEGGTGGGSDGTGDPGQVSADSADDSGADGGLLGGGPDGGLAAVGRELENPALPVGGATVLGVLGGAAILQRLRGSDDSDGDDPSGGTTPGFGSGDGSEGATGATTTEATSSNVAPTPGTTSGNDRPRRSTDSEEDNVEAATDTGDGQPTKTTDSEDDQSEEAPDETGSAGAEPMDTGDAGDAGSVEVDPDPGAPGATGATGSDGTSGPTVTRGSGAGPPGTVPTAPDVTLSFDDLEIGERIGTGGSADVHRATATIDGEPVSLAVKRPRFEGTLGREVIERHRSEAETWERLDGHENVVGLVDHGTQPVPWLAMEYMDGGDLTQRVDGPSYVERLWIGHRICEGVYHAHRHGVSHLDLKPGNVLFRSVEGAWDVPKVGDWGLSKQLLEGSAAGEGLSPSYAAPEQFDHSYGPTDHATDVYQLGAVLYELFTGRPPFEGPPNRVMNAVLTEEVVAPTERNPDLPAALDDALLPALERDRADRYDSVIYLRDEIEAIARSVR